MTTGGVALEFDDGSVDAATPSWYSVAGLSPPPINAQLDRATRAARQPAPRSRAKTDFSRLLAESPLPCRRGLSEALADFAQSGTPASPAGLPLSARNSWPRSSAERSRSKAR